MIFYLETEGSSIESAISIVKITSVFNVTRLSVQVLSKRVYLEYFWDGWTLPLI